MNDKVTVRMVVAILGTVALAVVAFQGAGALVHVHMPNTLTNLGSAALGAVAGLLAKTNTEPNPDLPTVVAVPQQPLEPDTMLPPVPPQGP